MSRRSGIRFADKDMRQLWNLQRFLFIWDRRVIPYEWKRCSREICSGPHRPVSSRLWVTPFVAVGLDIIVPEHPRRPQVADRARTEALHQQRHTEEWIGDRR